MGFCLLVATGFYSLKKHVTSHATQKVLWIFMITVMALDGLKCFTRNMDWRTEESIFLAGLKVSQNNAKLWNNVGHALESRQAHEPALKFFRQAVSNAVRTYINVIEMKNL